MAAIDLIVVRTYLNLFEAEVAKTALDAASIDSILRADDAGGMRPHLWTGSGVQLLVRADDAQRADEVLSANAILLHPPPGQPED